GQLVVDQALAKERAQAPSHARAPARHRPPVVEDFARSRRHEPRGHLEQGALAGAVGPTDQKRLPRLDREGDGIQETAAIDAPRHGPELYVQATAPRASPTRTSRTGPRRFPRTWAGCRSAYPPPRTSKRTAPAAGPPQRRRSR